MGGRTSLSVHKASVLSFWFDNPKHCWFKIVRKSSQLNHAIQPKWTIFHAGGVVEETNTQSNYISAITQFRQIGGNLLHFLFASPLTVLVGKGKMNYQGMVGQCCQLCRLHSMQPLTHIQNQTPVTQLAPFLGLGNWSWLGTHPCLLSRRSASAIANQVSSFFSI